MSETAMLQVECKGSPFEIGEQHGSSAKTQISRSIAFYASLFQRTSSRTWPQVQEIAAQFSPIIQEKWPRYYEEMRGIAKGSDHDILDIIAINIRTEIAFGLFSDGCTSLYWKMSKRSLLGQNWDWMEEQKQNLILITIMQEGKPTIKMVNEAGMLGKIGMNSAGVGVLFNAIRAKGLDMHRMPVHFGLRAVLESSSAKEAVETLERVGMASSAHMLIGDAGEAVGLEFSSTTFARLLMDEEGRVIHSNHYIGEHPGVVDTKWMDCSDFRVERMGSLTDAFAEKGQEPSFSEFSHLFEDEKNFPSAICRKQEGESNCATLFNIVMDLREKRAVVRMGRPSASEETVELNFN